MADGTMGTHVGETAANPWLRALQQELSGGAMPTLTEVTGSALTLAIRAGRYGLWLVATLPNGSRLAFLGAFAPDGSLVTSLQEEKRGAVSIVAESSLGRYHVAIELRASRAPLLRWTTRLTPAQEISFPFWPHDIYPLGDDDEVGASHGTIHTCQTGGPSTPLLFASTLEPSPCSFLYMQDATALNDYFEKTHTAPTGTIKSGWPTIGFALPAAEGRMIPAEKEITLSDAYVRFTTAIPQGEGDAARLFLDFYADIYLAMPRREALHRDWPRRTAQTIRDLTHSPVCSAEVDGIRYLNAYVGSDDRPPESMVQLAVLVPLVEYQQSRPEEEVPLIAMLEKTLDRFYDPELKAYIRWLPEKQRLLRGKEEHMKPELMDSWYLHHPLLNLARLGELGNAKAERLFRRSVDYAVTVAQHFEYRWPIFYDMYTLEAVKAERKPGLGGELDVGAQYAHVMLHAYDLTGEERYLEEAKIAARHLQGLGFSLFYQTNNTVFGAGALMRLWKMTGEQTFRDLSDLCMATTIRNLWLWECDYGHGRHYHTYMGLPPLEDAPYLALYEELEIMAAIDTYLEVGGEDVADSIRVLLTEYCRFLIDRAWFHYPETIPEEMLAEECQSGHLNRYISVPLEDIYDGWGKAGTVGQEIYGAAAPFVIATRHCHPIPGVNFVVHCNYPVTGKRIEKVKGRRLTQGGAMSFTVQGDPRLWCEVRIVPENFDPLPPVALRATMNGRTEVVDGILNERGQLEFRLRGDADVTVAWGAAIRTRKLAAKGARTAARNGNGKSRSDESSKSAGGGGKKPRNGSSAGSHNGANGDGLVHRDSQQKTPGSKKQTARARREARN